MTGCWMQGGGREPGRAEKPGGHLQGSRDSRVPVRLSGPSVEVGSLLRAGLSPPAQNAHPMLQGPHEPQRQGPARVLSPPDH